MRSPQLSDPNEYDVGPTRALLYQVGMLWTKAYLDNLGVPKDKKGTARALRDDLKKWIAEEEG